MKTEFDPVTHTYRCNDEIWPSVTQLLSEFKLSDFSMVPPDVLANKQRLGTIVHKAAELLDEQQLDEEHFNKTFPEAIPYLDAYKRFREIEDFEPAHIERKMFSKKYKCAGTLDRQGIFQDVETIIDLKCSWEIYPSNAAQLAAYAMLFEENYKTRIKRRFALQLKPNGHYELEEFKSPHDIQDFLACVWLYWRRRDFYKTIKGENQNGNGHHGNGTEASN